MSQLSQQQFEEIISRPRPPPPRFKCVLCNTSAYGYGNNAFPLEKGKCCDACNIKVVAERIIRNKNQ